MIKVFYLLSKAKLNKSETRFFGRKTAEDNNAKLNFFFKEHPLKTLNKRTHIPLLITQFVFLIELKM